MTPAQLQVTAVRAGSRARRAVSRAHGFIGVDIDGNDVATICQHDRDPRRIGDLVRNIGDEVITLHRANERQCGSCVSARGLDDPTVFTEMPLGLGLLYHPQGDPVLYASAGVQKFRFDENFGPAFPADAIQTNQGMSPINRACYRRY